MAGRCLPNDINPCLGNLCEQRCSVFFGRVVCTCFAGYNFNREKHLESTPEAPVKACEDKDECQVNNGDCEQVLEKDKRQMIKIEASDPILDLCQ